MDKTALFTNVSEIITDYLRLDEGELIPESHMLDDLGADSLALIELGFKFSESFGIGMLTPSEDILVIDNLVNHIYAELN